MTHIFDSREPPGEEAAGKPEISEAVMAAPGRRTWSSLTFPFVARSGREMSVTLALEPVFSLADGRRAALRVRRSARHAGGEAALLWGGRRQMEAADLRRLDLLTLQKGLEALQAEQASCGVLPLYWRTASTAHGRFSLIYAGLQDAALPERLAVEIVGAPQGRDADLLVETLSHFQTERQQAVVQVPPDATLAARLEGAGCGCLVMDFAGVAYDAPRGWAEAERLIAAARRAADGLLILNIAPHWGPAAFAAGATHAVFAAMPGVRV